jgi:preprotein translocase subunit SecE
MFERFIEFLKESRAELGKITWPTRDELRESTWVVIVSAIAITAFIGAVDQVFNYMLKLLIRAM